MCDICQDVWMDVRLDSLESVAIRLYEKMKTEGMEPEGKRVFDRTAQLDVPHQLFWKMIAKGLLKVCKRHDAKHLTWEARKVIDRAEAFARAHKKMEDERRALNIADENADLAGTERDTTGEAEDVDYAELMKGIT